jgi:hypothetical protein
MRRVTTLESLIGDMVFATSSKDVVSLIRALASYAGVPDDDEAKIATAILDLIRSSENEDVFANIVSQHAEAILSTPSDSEKERGKQVGRVKVMARQCYTRLHDYAHYKKRLSDIALTDYIIAFSTLEELAQSARGWCVIVFNKTLPHQAVCSVMYFECIDTAGNPQLRIVTNPGYVYEVLVKDYERIEMKFF